MSVKHLRTKILLASVPVFVLGGLAFSFAAYAFVQPGFQEIENKSAIDDAGRAKDALDNRLTVLSQKTSDWSSWDDAYNFVINQNKAFVKANLQNQAMGNLGIDYILFYNADHKLVLMKHVELDAPGFPTRPLDPGVEKLLAPTSALLRYSGETDVHNGVVIIPEGILMLASHPLLDSNAHGPIRGSVVFAQYLDKPAQEGLSKQTHLNLAYLPANDPSVSHSVPAYPSTSTKGAQWVSLIDANRAQAFATITDIYGHPTIAARVEGMRTISEEGQKSLQDFLLVALLVGLSTMLAMAGLLNWLIVDRIMRLSRQLRAVENVDDSRQSVEVLGNDELSKLGNTINDLFARIRSAYGLKATNSTLEQQVLQRTSELASQLDQMKRVNDLMVDRELRMKELKEQNAKLRAKLGPD